MKNLDEKIMDNNQMNFAVRAIDFANFASGLAFKQYENISLLYGLILHIND